MKNIKRITFSLNNNLVEEFREVCKEYYLNQSAIIASKLKEVIEEYKSKK
ncbi:MAG TPA: hypothetical protein VIM42_04975 [Clostridium sp.]